MANLKKLAKELAPAFQCAAWGNVEDDVGLCLWIHRQCGEDLTMHQVASMRKAMQEEIETFPQVVVFVEGGVITGCTSNDARLRVVVVDWDDIKQSEYPDKAEQEALEGTADCVHEVR